MAAAAVQAEGHKDAEGYANGRSRSEKYTQDMLLGEVWKRLGLSARDRSVVTLAALIARNQTIEMAFYLNLALDNGVKAPRDFGDYHSPRLLLRLGERHVGGCRGKGCLCCARYRRRSAPCGLAGASALNEAAEADRAARVGQQFGEVAPGVVQ